VSEDNFLTKALVGTDLTRRSFLKWSAALGGAVAATGGGGGAAQRRQVGRGLLLA
jgi:hypothetical protein